MSIPQASADFYRNQQRLSLAVLANLRRLWRQMGVDFDQSWRTVGPRVVALVVAGQVAAVRQVEPYVAAVLGETGQLDRPAAKLNPTRFATTAGDGRPLDTLLYGAVIQSKVAFDGSPDEALAVGGRWLDMAAQTTLADASRSATSAAITVRPDVGGYVRMVNPPACSRCIILAGKFFRWNTGFSRHPRCDCRHIPSSENVADDFTTSPSRYFDSLGTAEQDRAFGKAGAQAIRDGGDIGQVVNARAGMYTTADGNKATRAGTSSRGRTPGRVRLMPEAIYKQAPTRSEAIELLRTNGFLN